MLEYQKSRLDKSSVRRVYNFFIEYKNTDGLEIEQIVEIFANIEQMARIIKMSVFRIF